MKAMLAALLLAAAAPAAAAADPSPAPEAPGLGTPEAPEAGSPEALVEEGSRLIIEGLRGLLERLPRYGLPHLDDDGNLVIPRLPADPDAPERDRQRPTEPGVPI